MSDQPARTCSDCDGELQAIVVMDVGHQGAVGQLQYYSSGDKRSFWTGRFPTAGTVQAFLCQDCGLISLFGQPKPRVEQEVTEEPEE